MGRARLLGRDMVVVGLIEEKEEIGQRGGY